MIIFVLDKDIIDCLGVGKSDADCEDTMHRCLSWLVNSVENLVHSQKEDYYAKKPGAITPAEPKYIWINCLNWPHFDQVMRMAKDTFNFWLQESIHDRRHFYLIDISEQVTQYMFKKNGELSGQGQVQYWKAIDKNLEQFDKQEISLKPISQLKNDQATRNAASPRSPPPPQDKPTT